MKKVLYCPHCEHQHLDSRWWAHNPHKNHQCLFKDCRKTFRTVECCIGVRKEHADAL